MTARENVAAAASTADGVRVSPYYRQGMKAGEGFVRFASQSPDPSGFGYMTTWEVWLLAPADMVTAEKWIEAKVPALLAALERQLFNLNVTPQELNLGDQITNGLILAGTRGAD